MAPDQNKIPIVEPLIGNSSDVDSSAIDGYKPSLTAALEGHLDLVKLLLKHNANIHLEKETDKTAVYQLVALLY